MCIANKASWPFLYRRSLWIRREQGLKEKPMRLALKPPRRWSCKHCKIQFGRVEKKIECGENVRRGGVDNWVSAVGGMGGGIG